MLWRGCSVWWILFFCNYESARLPSGISENAYLARHLHVREAHAGLMAICLESMMEEASEV